MYLILRLNQRTVRLLSSFRSAEKALMIYPWHLKSKKDKISWVYKKEIGRSWLVWVAYVKVSLNCHKDRSDVT